MKQKKEKKINLKSENKENYNYLFTTTELEALNTVHDIAVNCDEVHYQFLKQLTEPS